MQLQGSSLLMKQIGTSTDVRVKQLQTQILTENKKDKQFSGHQKHISQQLNIQKKYIIKDYEKRIDSMSYIILKLNKKIQSQQEEFKQLNQKLNNAINKLTPAKIKQPLKKSEDAISKQSNLKRQLQNQLKKSKNMKKQLDNLKEITQIYNNQQKFIELKNQIFQKTKQIKELKQKLKIYERAEISQKNMSQHKKQQDINKKLFQLNQENIFLKKKVNQMKLKIENNQKKQKINAKNQMQSGIVNKNKKGITAQRSKQKSVLIKIQDHDEQIKKLENQIKSLESIKLTMQKSNKIELQSLKSKNRILNQQVQTLRQQIRRKNKQTFILEHKNNSMRKSHFVKKKIISSIGDYQNQFDGNQSIQNDKNERYKTLDIKLRHTQKDSIFGDLKKEYLGLNYLSSDNYKKSDDSLKLDQSKAYKIIEIMFEYFQEHILSMKVKYKYNNAQIVQIQTFQIEHSYSNIKTTVLNFGDFQYVKQMDIYCNKMIQLIVIKTSRQHIIQIGNQKNQPKCKKYSFNIKSHQKPIAFAAITMFKKINDIKKQCLVSLGIIIKKKDVSILRKKIHSIKIDNDPYLNGQTDKEIKNTNIIITDMPKNNQTNQFLKKPQLSK